jgi:hypothetical protein
MSRSFILFVIVLWCSAGATTRHVPTTEYPTIQAALDALMEGDTVLVDTGLYEEALLAPSLDFVLRGNVADTTGGYARPIVDPSSLPDPGSQSCLRQDSGWTVIEDMTFRNRRPMYPHMQNIAGGVDHPNGNLTVRRCVFDSTVNPIFASSGKMTLSRCDFWNMNDYGPRSWDTAMVYDCRFESNTVLWAQVTGRDGSRIERCQFSGNYGGGNAVLNLGPTDIQVRDCLIGPGESLGAIMIMFLCSDCVFENNVIEDWTYGQTLLGVQTLVPGDVVIRNNVMRDCHVRGDNPQAFLSGYDLWTYMGCDTCAIYFDDNIIENCSSINGTPGVKVRGWTDYGQRNRFTQITPVAALNMGAQWTLRNNLFYGNDPLALQSQGSTDALWNWWGDSTGPYHELLNPGGLGDAIEGNVQFDPWYADTAFFHPDATPPGRHSLPEDYSLRIFPNPFNPSTTLRFGVVQTERVTVEVYNLAGQNVQTLADREFTVGYHEVAFDASELPSGIYFAQMRAGSVVKTEKMVLLR